jgi:hypothetical protein
MLGLLVSCAAQNPPAPARAPLLASAPASAAPRAILAEPTPVPSSTIQARSIAAEPAPPSLAGEPGAGTAIGLDEASHAYRAPLPSLLASDAPAMRIANLAPAACRAQVLKQGLPLKRDRRPTPGVATALRFTGPLSGVTFLTAGWKSPYGVMDCRLALAFAEMAKVLSRYQVSEVHCGTIYRSNSKLASRKLSQHAHGLAADVVAFRLADGRLLDIENDFAGELGAPVCGPDGRLTDNREQALILRNLLCDLAREGVFHYILTPNYDQAHHDHVHLDIKRDAQRTVIR